MLWDDNYLLEVYPVVQHWNENSNIVFFLSAFLWNSWKFRLLEIQQLSFVETMMLTY